MDTTTTTTAQYTAGITYAEQFSGAPLAWLADEIVRVAAAIKAEPDASTDYRAGMIAGYAAMIGETK